MMTPLKLLSMHISLLFFSCFTYSWICSLDRSSLCYFISLLRRTAYVDAMYFDLCTFVFVNNSWIFRNSLPPRPTPFSLSSSWLSHSAVGLLILPLLIRLALLTLLVLRCALRYNMRFLDVPDIPV